MQFVVCFENVQRRQISKAFSRHQNESIQTDNHTGRAQRIRLDYLDRTTECIHIK
jgi:hypothetical protein